MKGEKCMKKSNLAKLSRNVMRIIDKNIPHILTGLGISLGVSTVILAVKGTPKALRLIDEDIARKNEDLALKAKEEGRTCRVQVTGLKPMEIVKATWKCYVPAAITGTLSIACLLGADTVHSRRATALAAACKLYETALSEYKEKVIETIGEKKEESIRDEINKDKLEANPVSKSEVIITEKGNTLCYDSISGRYFKSDIDKIKGVLNELNKRMLSEMYISLTEFYLELGLDQTSVSDQLGWSLDRGCIEIDCGSQIAEDVTPCVVLNYPVAPKNDYASLCITKPIYYISEMP